SFGRSGVEKSDHRHRLLPACREWPRSHRTTNHFDELAPVHVAPEAQEKAAYRLKLAQWSNVRFGSFATDAFRASGNQCPLCPQERPNPAAQRNVALCQKRTFWPSSCHSKP